MFDFIEIFPLADAFLGGALALSALVACKCGLQLVVGKLRTPWWIEYVFVLAAMTTISVLTIDAIRYFDQESLAGLAPLPGLAILSLAMLVAWLHLQVAALRLPAEQLRQRPAPWLLLASVAAIGLWSGYRFQLVTEPPNWQAPIVLSRPVNMEPETQFIGISDRGREIPLFRSTSERLTEEQTYRVHAQTEHPAQKGGVITRGGPDTSSNCHGWVFTGGEFLLDEAGIQTILADNGYALCSTPEPGDVIVYYAGVDMPVHTGLVSGVLTDGTVIIESKWGLDRRYLHCPEDQPYSTSFVYYRSSRKGNEIDIRATKGALAKQRAPGRRNRRA